MESFLTPQAAGQPHPKPSSKIRMCTFAGAKMKCVPPEGISQKHPVLPSAPRPLPTQQRERSFPANAEIEPSTRTQGLEVKAPEQYVGTFSAWKTQHISMQTTVCLECFSYLSKGTCDQSWVWFCFLLKSFFHSISLGFLKYIHRAYYFNWSS